MALRFSFGMAIAGGGSSEAILLRQWQAVVPVAVVDVIPTKRSAPKERRENAIYEFYPPMKWLDSRIWNTMLLVDMAGGSINQIAFFACTVHRRALPPLFSLFDVWF